MMGRGNYVPAHDILDASDTLPSWRIEQSGLSAVFCV